jgi:hypothetical protein
VAADPVAGEDNKGSHNQRRRGQRPPEKSPRRDPALERDRRRRLLGRLGDVSDRRDESVAASRQGFEITRAVRVVVQRGPNLADAEVHALVEIDERVGTPHGAANLIGGDELPGPFDQQGQEPRRLWL